VSGYTAQQIYRKETISYEVPHDKLDPTLKVVKSLKILRAYWHEANAHRSDSIRVTTYTCRQPA
jgi:hypothetical protein